MHEELEEYLEYLEKHSLDDGHDITWVASEILEVREVLRDEQGITNDK